jgi:CMP-N,N'-diacetyllegionaminic acid synthase
MNIALIPARAGSKRIPSKNLRILNGEPLICYTIRSALKSNIFSEVIVSTDSQEIGNIAKAYGAKVPLLRPSRYATDTSSDIEWVQHALSTMVENPLELIETVAILRPTSPLRSSNSILNALDLLKGNQWADSVRAMEVTHKHPGKMWVLDKDNKARPYLDQIVGRIPTYNSPTQTLQKLWIQNASLEIVKLKALVQTNSISGNTVLGFEMPNFEGFDLNDLRDLEYLEFLISKYPEIIK